MTNDVNDGNFLYDTFRASSFWGKLTYLENDGFVFIC